MESCPTNSRLGALSKVGNQGSSSAGVETFLAGTVQFSSALTAEDSGDLGHRLVTDLD